MGILARLGLVLTGMALSGTRAAGPDEAYYREGPLAGSLKSDRPLPLYDKDPEHLWNRLFAAFYIRPGENPTSGQPRRIEGGDAYLEPLLWPETPYFSTPEFFARASRLLDEFPGGAGEKPGQDPLKRALFQHDLWAVFYRLQQQGNFGGREAAVRREAFCKRLVRAIKAVALSQEEIATLPDNYAIALESGHFAGEHRFDPKADYLPRDLLVTDSDWVEITYPTHVPPYHTHDFGGRSYFRIFYNFPEGRRAVADYLKYVAEEGTDRAHPDATRRAVLKPGLRQIPAGTQVALVQAMMLLDKDLRPVPTRLVQDVRMRLYKGVEGQADLATTSGEGVNIYAYALKRALVLGGLRHGGLEREPNDLKVYRPLFHFREDWGRPKGREGLGFMTVATHCIACHGHKPGGNQGVYSLHSLHAAFSLRGSEPNGPPGIAAPMSPDAPSQAERARKLVLSRDEYKRLRDWAKDK